MSLPNLFTHARSELAQDAVLAYLLEWAAPQHRASHPDMNALGEALLRALFAASAATLSGPTLGATDPLTEVRVTTQKNGIDVIAFVNGTFALIIEDKVETHEHTHQIERYTSRLACKSSPSDMSWVVHAVYVKTGNESPHRRPDTGYCGVIMRSGLLAILDRFLNVENQIVREFRDHLHRIHAETECFRTLPRGQWPKRGIEGFYGKVTDWLAERYGAGDLAVNPKPKWSYQPNPQGGEYVCAWSWTQLEGLSSFLWLQLHDADTLQIRMANDQQESGKPKVEPRQLHATLDRLTRAATAAPWEGNLWIRKAGRFGGGDSAAVAELTFAADTENWLPQNHEGLLDWPEATRRLLLAMQFLASIRLGAEAKR